MNFPFQDSRLNPIRAYDSQFYGHEFHTQTPNIFCRNWMELNANFGLQGRIVVDVLVERV